MALRAAVLVVALLLAAMALPLGHAAGPVIAADANTQFFRDAFAFDARVTVTRNTSLVLIVESQLEGNEYDAAYFLRGSSDQGGHFFYYQITSASSAPGETDVAVQGSHEASRPNDNLHVAGGAEFLVPLEPGQWRFEVAGAATVHGNSSVHLGLDGEATPLAFRHARAAGIVTIRDLVGGDHVWLRAFSLGAGLSLHGSAEVESRGPMSGLAFYRPPAGPDQHVMTVSWPTGVTDADLREFEDEVAGPYTVRLDETSFGKFPGQMGFLWADFEGAIG